MNIHKSQLFWCELQGIPWVLTHPQMPVEVLKDHPPKNPPTTTHGPPAWAQGPFQRPLLEKRTVASPPSWHKATLGKPGKTTGTCLMIPGEIAGKRHEKTLLDTWTWGKHHRTIPRERLSSNISNIGSEMFEDSGVKSGIEFEVFGEILRESWVNEDILSK